MAASKKNQSKSSKPKHAKPIPKKPGRGKSDGTEKARKAAVAEIQARLDGKEVKPVTVGKKTPKEPKRLSAIDAAAKILTGTGKAARCKDLIAEMEKQGLWKSPGGKTPEATLYSSILREITVKGAESRFKKVERGLFAATGKEG